MSPVDALGLQRIDGNAGFKEILVNAAPREETAPNSRKNVAMIKLNVFIKRSIER
jgi:hypothetical protein